MMLRSSVRSMALATVAVFSFAVTVPAVLGQTGPTGTPAKQPPAKSAPPSKAAASKAPAAKEKAPPADPNVPEKEFTVTAMNGTKVKCVVYPNPNWPGKIVRFDPYLPQTENNVFSASLNSMWEIYGRQRGTFNMNDGSLSQRSGLPGNIVVYKLRSGGKFCVYAVRDDKSKSLVEIKVWME